MAKFAAFLKASLRSPGDVLVNEARQVRTNSKPASPRRYLCCFARRPFPWCTTSEAFREWGPYKAKPRGRSLLAQGPRPLFLAHGDVEGVLIPLLDLETNYNGPHNDQPGDVVPNVRTGALARALKTRYGYKTVQITTCRTNTPSAPERISHSFLADSPRTRERRCFPRCGSLFGCASRWCGKRWFRPRWLLLQARPGVSAMVEIFGRVRSSIVFLCFLSLVCTVGYFVDTPGTLPNIGGRAAEITKGLET